MIRDISRRDVIDMVDRIVDGGSPVAANRTLTVAKTFFNWCVARDILTASPAQGVKPPTAEKSRDRVLDDTELKLVWEAAGQVGYPFGTMTRLLITTGQRRDEVAKMRWEEVDFGRRLWTLPRERVKADRPHEVEGAAPRWQPIRAYNQRRRTLDRLWQKQEEARRASARKDGAVATARFTKNVCKCSSTACCSRSCHGSHIKSSERRD
jgi:integrase